MRAALALLALALSLVDAYTFAAARSMRLRARSPVLQAEYNPDDRDEATKKEDDALAAAFAARLDAEGGATQFKIKTTVKDATDQLKGVASSAQDAASNLPDIKQASGLQLVIGLLVATVLFTGITSMGRSSVDLNTSDGTNLEFGQRQERNYDPYKPQYGSQ